MRKTIVLLFLFLFGFGTFMDTAWATASKKRKSARTPIVISKNITKKPSKKATQQKKIVSLKTNSKIRRTIVPPVPPKKRIAKPPAKAPKTKTNVQPTILPTINTQMLTSMPPLNTPKNITKIVSEFEKKLLKTIKDKHIPGCAVAIVYKNQVVFINGYGLRTLGKPETINVDTVFQLGSVSKPIAATLSTILENRGILNVNDPVSQYLPNFSLNNVKDRSALRIKHVLSHSTGIPRAGFNHLIETFSPHARIIRTLQTTNIRAPIGKRYDYHNAMFSLISEITMAATHQSFPTALATYLLQPLKMNNTTATYNGLLKTTNRASPHIKNNKGKMVAAGTYSTGYYDVAPAGGINSSIRDMSTFLKAQLGGYPSFLDSATLTRLQQPIITTPTVSLSAINGARDKIKNARYGLGWRVINFNDKKLVYHGGWVKGFTNFIAFMPEQQIGIVVLHNSETKFSGRLAMQFLDIFFSNR